MQTKPIVEALKNAKTRILNKDNWTTDTFAQNDAGKDVIVSDPNATKLCALGSLCRTQEEAEWTPHIAHEFLSNAAIVVLGEKYDRNKAPVPQLNDELGFEAVHKAYDIAISNAEKGVIK